MVNGNRTTGTKSQKPTAAIMLRSACAALLAAGLIAAPLPALAQQSSAPAPSTTEKTKPKRTLTPGQIAAQERQKKCAAEWKVAKAAGKVEKGITWPKYWSACNKRLKGAAA